MWRINNCAILFSASPPNHRKEKEEEMATSLVSLHPERMRNNNITGEQWRASSHYHQMSSHKHLAAKKSGDLGLRPCATYEAIHQIGTEFWTRHYMKFLKQMDRQADAWQTAIMELPVAAKTATTSPDIQARSRLSPSVILIGGIQAGYQKIHVYSGTWIYFLEYLRRKSPANIIFTNTLTYPWLIIKLLSSSIIHKIHWFFYCFQGYQRYLFFWPCTSRRKYYALFDLCVFLHTWLAP